MTSVSANLRRRVVREMLRIIYGKFLSRRLRRMRPRDGRRHGPYVSVAKALGHGVTHRDVRFAWTGRKPGSRNALVRIVAAVEKLL